MRRREEERRGEKKRGEEREDMILLPSDAHSNVIINQHCRALPVPCHALIVLLQMISGNVHVHPGTSTVASPNSDLCSNFCFND
ncbi:hypothetical protein J4Q44_G00229270, partial [Coregonus suidteri]